jgi:hypothetical protein
VVLSEKVEKFLQCNENKNAYVGTIQEEKQEIITTDGLGP